MFVVFVSVFFFFKQKTAYEMRISDWSSDVCSSDLPVLAVHARGGLLHDRLRVDDADRHAFGGAEGEILDRALRLRAPIGVGGNRNRAQRIGFGAGRLSHTASIRPALVEGPLFSCDRRSRVKNGRSEEHTSELQSLMRISYAVFCLN